ncbi:MAG: hypothetical protein ACLU99_10520 [Alphaproteobacteria bacterium]
MDSLIDDYTSAVAAAVNNALQTNGIPAASVDAIGFHGQTCALLPALGFRGRHLHVASRKRANACRFDRYPRYF